jgi:hypothetical protein
VGGKLLEEITASTSNTTLTNANPNNAAHAFDIATFLARRIKRLTIPSCFCLVFICWCLWFVSQPFGKDILYAALHVVNIWYVVY